MAAGTPDLDDFRALVHRLVHLGHSLAFGFGASGPDKDVLTRVASTLAARELPWSKNGAVLAMQNANPDANGNGGYNTIANQVRKRRRPHGTVRTLALAGATAVDVGAATDGVWTAFDRVSVGKGTNATDTYISGVSGTSPLQTLALTEPLTNNVDIGDPVYVVPHAYESPEPLSVLWYGLNDIAAYGTGSGGSGTASVGERTFKEVLRAAIAYVMTAGDGFFDANHSSSARSTNAPTVASAGVGIGVQLRALITAGHQVTIDVPANFPGGDFYAFVMANSGGGGVTSWTVDGVDYGTLDTRDIGYPAHYVPLVKVFKNLAPGRHVIVGTVSVAAGAAGQYFNGCGVRAETPGGVVLPGFNRPFRYDLWVATATWRYAQAKGTVNANHPIGTSTFTITAPVNLATTPAAHTIRQGELLTFDPGGPNEESLVVAADATGTTVTTTTASARAHNTGEAYIANMQDKAITDRARKWIPDLIAQGDFPQSAVRHVAIDDALAKQRRVFTYDGVHFNDLGNQIVAQRIGTAVKSLGRTLKDLVYKSNVPISPVAAPVYFLGPLATGAAGVAPGAAGAVTVTFPNTLHTRDLRRSAYAKLTAWVSTAGGANSRGRVEYSTGDGIWKTLGRNAVWQDTAIGTAGQPGQIDLATTGRKDSDWFLLPAEVFSVPVTFLRYVAGNIASPNPAYQYVQVEFA